MLGSSPRNISLAYRSMAMMIDSGHSIESCLENFNNSLNLTDKVILRRIITRVRNGNFLNLAMAAEELNPLDVSLIKLGESSGTLSENAKYLAEFYEERHEIEQSIKRSLYRPGMLIVLSLFLNDLPNVFSGKISVAHYLAHALGVLGALGMVIFAIFQIYRATYRSRKIAEGWVRFFLMIPCLSGVIRSAAYERFFTALTLSLKSGLGVPAMLELGSDLTSLPKFKLQMSKILERSKGAGISQAFEESGLFRSDHLLIVRTGEASGQLEESFEKIKNELRAELKNSIRIIENWLPRIIYGLAMIYALYGIVSSVRETFNNPQLEKLLKE